MSLFWVADIVTQSIIIIILERVVMNKNKLFLGIGAALFAFEGMPIFAQSDDSTALESDDGTTLEEIIVTVRKRQESMNDVPMSVSAITGDQLDKQAVTGMHDLADRIPGLQIMEAFVDEQIGIRGMSTTAGNQGFEQTVSLFVDGVYYGRGRWLRQGFFDLQSVEVLRGPQPVYFGKNTSAGALNLSSRNPGEEFEASIKFEYETEFEEIITEGVVSGPLADTLGARLAVHKSTGDAWITNTADGPDGVDDRDNLMARLSLVWNASEDVEIITKVQHAAFSSDGRTSQVAICSPDMRDAVAAAGSTEDCMLNDTRTSGALPNDTSAKEAIEQEDYESTSVSVTANVTIGEFELTSVSAFTSYENHTSADADFWDGSQFIWVERPEEEDGFAQELRLVSPDYDGFSYVVGGYYASNELTTNNDTIWGLAPSAGIAFASARKVQQDGDTWSVFGEFNIDISDTLSATIGGRYTEDEKDLTHRQDVGSLADAYDDDPFAQAVLAAIVTETDFSASRDSDNFSPSAQLNWTPNEDVMYYASYSEGFKSGGFDHNAASEPTNVMQELIYDDEEAESFEVGGKFTLADGAAQLNVAIFHTEFDSLQVSTYDGNADFNVGNAGAATSKGFEMDGQWLVSEGLKLYGLVAYADATYDEFPSAPCYKLQTAEQGCGSGTTATTQDLKGRTLARAPEWQASLGFDWDKYLTDDLRLDIGMDANYSSDLFFSTDQDPMDTQDSFWLMNARIGISSADQAWTIALIVKNLLDEEVIVNSSDIPFQDGSHWAMLGMARTIHLQAVYNFY